MRVNLNWKKKKKSISTYFLERIANWILIKKKEALTAYNLSFYFFTLASFKYIKDIIKNEKF